MARKAAWPSEICPQKPVRIIRPSAPMQASRHRFIKCKKNCEEPAGSAAAASSTKITSAF